MQDIQGIFFRDFHNAYIPDILTEIYKQRVYAPYLESKQNKVVLDIGANIGLFSFYAREFSDKVYAFEPAMEHFEALTYMISFNKYQNIIPIKQAVANEDGEAVFHHSSNTTMYSLNAAVANTGESETVETVRLDTLFKELELDHVDFMKIDIEGAEGQVIGGEGFDNVADKIDTIMGEWHTWAGVSPEQFASYFRDRGFKFRWFKDTDASLFVAEHE